MAIFRREPEPAAPASIPVTPRPTPSPMSRDQRRPTVIAPGTQIVGKITGNTELQIEGALEGEVHLETDLVVGPGGQVKGDIHARTVRISGKVAGNVSGAERVELLASGTLEGDVSAPRVIIAEGAFFKGRVEMAPDKGGVPPVKKPAPEKSAGPPGE